MASACADEPSVTEHFTDEEIISDIIQSLKFSSNTESEEKEKNLMLIMLEKINI